VAPPERERGLFVRAGPAASGVPVSDRNGSPLQFRRPAERFTARDWIAVEFTTGDGNVVHLPRRRAR
jgi:hypothetical protein